MISRSLPPSPAMPVLRASSEALFFVIARRRFTRDRTPQPIAAPCRCARTVLLTGRHAGSDPLGAY